MSAVTEKDFYQGSTVRIQFLKDNVARIQIAPPGGKFKDTGLNRYGFINEPDSSSVDTGLAENHKGFSAETTKICVRGDNHSGSLTVTDKVSGKVLLQQIGFEFNDSGAKAKFQAKTDEDWVGFGDQTRERLYHRGHIADLHVRNVKSYIPVPFFMSTEGVGVMVNTTHRIIFDMCKSEPEQYSWLDLRGGIDYYVMAGEGFRELLDCYTELSGKPKLPPEWAFGLWYICRMQANDHEAVSDALNFRREGLPCDVIGLEPGWMEKDYDLSTEKKWNDKLFPIPSYCQNGPHNFINVIKRMGFKFELWLCNEYDLSLEEERRLGRLVKASAKEESTGNFHEDAEVDEHFSWPRYSDQITKKDEPWYEHLKKFVDQGADFFKQDGAFQVCDHPDRVWGNGMLDAEMHNIYPLFYSRQMHEGFAEHTGRRPVVFTPDGWIGFQAWSATWTGDTGGRLETLGAMLNTSIVGHSWSTNDMEVIQKEGIHFGYLLPWSQINSWNYFRMPWVQGDELLKIHKFYGEFRARIIPYLYSWAYYATKTGWPLMLPLTFEFPEDGKCRDNLHQYLLGRDLMVGIYKNDIYFPEGRWKDFWTGEVIEGNQEKSVSWPDNRGGSMHVRAGGIIPFGPLMQYRGEKPLDEIELYIFPDEKESSFELYEDDGVSFKALEGECAKTLITARKNGGKVSIGIGETQGRYDGQPVSRIWSAVVAVESKPSAVMCNGKNVSDDRLSWNDSRKEVKISKIKGHAEITVSF